MMLIFLTIVMPGIAGLDDGEFLRAFQVMDGIIQAGDPVFMLCWVGSVLCIVGTAIYGVVRGPLVGNTTDTSLEEPWQAIGLVVAALAWIVCQVVTFTVNIPRNNRVQALDIANMESEDQLEERTYFEATWNKA